MNTRQLMLFSNRDYDLMHSIWKDYVSVFASTNIATVEDYNITLEYLSYQFSVTSKLVMLDERPHFQVRFTTTSIDDTHHSFDLFINDDGGLFSLEGKIIDDWADVLFARNYAANDAERLFKQLLANFLMSQDFFNITR